ncbi:hypothetical protein AGLY_010695, partial [Aphis glycines]
SERSDEYIDFTLIITSRNNASISNFGGGFRWKKVKSKHFLTVFKKIEKNKNKMTEKREFLRKTGFRPNRFFIWLPLKFSIFMRIFFEVSNSKYNTKFFISFPLNIYKENSKHHYKKNFNVDKIFLALFKYLKILYKVPHIIHKHNFFLLAFEVQILTKIRQNYEYLQIIFPRSTPPPNVQQNGTHLPAYFFF